MELIKWNSDLSVHIVSIDTQHQKLIALINELHEAMKQGKGNLVLKEIVKGMIDYTVFHFQTEERYFSQFKYSDMDAHKKEHDDFVEKVIRFKIDFEQGKLGLSITVMTFLSQWIENHIKGSDKKYVPLFIENGVR